MNIIITGASRGIGFEVARILSMDPQNRVIAVARSKDGLDRLKKEGNGNIRVIAFDLQKDDMERELIPEIISVADKVDILVNNAGLLVNKPFRELDGVDFDLMFGANVKGPFRLIRALLPFFGKPSHIVNISSMGGFQGSAKFPGLSLYSASKGALAVLSECLAEELKDQGIAVNCLALGSAQTEMLAQAFPGYKAPLTATEMATFIADFALRGHYWFNGKILPVSLSTP